MGLILIARDAAWQADLWMFHLVNGWSGNWVLDWGAIYASKTYLLNGAIIMAAYWWVWFLPGPDQDRRTKIISALIAAIITLIVARALASVLPFRLRPLSREAVQNAAEPFRCPMLLQQPEAIFPGVIAAIGRTAVNHNG